jgi:glycosyltransferase involved in cell wall biosynthesis
LSKPTEQDQIKAKRPKAEEPMKISIAMCTYNGARYLEEQLASIVAQTRQPDQLVVCDDASTDGTRAMLTSFAATSPVQIKLKTNPVRLGSTKNFEQAITLCDGDVIALCDQDDVWLPEKLALTEDAFAGNSEADLVFTDGELVDENGNSLNCRLWQVYKVDARKLHSQNSYELLDRQELITGATIAFRSRFKDLVLPIPPNTPLIHDGWISLMIAHAGRLKPIDQPLIKYRQHSAQQVGARAKDLERRSSALESARRETDFDQELRRIAAVRERMNAFEGKFDFKGRENIEAIQAHFTIRKANLDKKLANAPSLFSELFRGRYHRYSNGTSSFLKDLARIYRMM